MKMLLCNNCWQVPQRCKCGDAYNPRFYMLTDASNPIELNIIFFHGLYSQGDNGEILQNRLECDAEFAGINCVISQHDYPRLGVWSGWKGYSRDFAREHILKCLSLEFHQMIALGSPGARIVVICHSNATFAIERALTKYYIDSKGLCEKIRIDKLILFGSVIEKHCDWSRFPDIDVVNFVGSKDRVSKMAPLFGMGSSGARGFKKKSDNLQQWFLHWKHSDFVDDANYGFIKNQVML